MSSNIALDCLRTCFLVSKLHSVYLIRTEVELSSYTYIYIYSCTTYVYFDCLWIFDVFNSKFEIFFFYKNLKTFGPNESKQNRRMT